jgi:hypothetical protein
MERVVNQNDRKSILRNFKDSVRPIGVFRVWNKQMKKSLVGSATNLPGILNRNRFELESGSHRDKEIQIDWNTLGSDAFDFEILETLKPQEDPTYDPVDDLRILKQLWLEKLISDGETIYKYSSIGA